ncbi:unnamed protein product [Rhodiola kirilowii]
MQYANTFSTVPAPTIFYPVIDTEEHFLHADAFPEMVPEIGTSDDIAESSNYMEHQTENFEANKFFNLLNSCGEPAYSGCTTETELSINMKMLATKANYGLSEGAFNAICGMMKALIGGHKIPSSFKESKKLVSDLELGYQRIDVCVRGGGGVYDLLWLRRKFDNMSFLLRTKISLSKTYRKCFIVPTKCEKADVLLADYTAFTETFFI